MDDLQLLIDLHKRAKRQGPGGDLEFKGDEVPNEYPGSI